MILVDISQTIIANIMMSPEFKDSKNLNIDNIRKMVLLSIKALNNKFKNDYGKLIVVADSANVWRKDYFPYYKIKRRQSKNDALINWNTVHEIIETLHTELKDYFPYPVIKVDKAEADDLIASLCKTYGVTSEYQSHSNQKILIVSRDKDFAQLQKYINVKQWNMIDEKWVKVDDPALFLKEHIIRGDSGDSIPSILSDDNVFALKIRQKPIMKKKLEVWLTQDWQEFCDEDTLNRVERNRKLIDLSQVPEEIHNAAIKQLAEQSNKPKNKILNYMIKHRLADLMSDIQDF